MLHLLVLCVLFNTPDAGDPTLRVVPDTGVIDVTPPSASELLTKARALKATVSPGYGDFYRRAAWAAFQDAPEDVSDAILILDELLVDPESVFDVFDAQRIAGQLLLAANDAVASLARYRAALELGRQDLLLIDSHPVLSVSIMQGAASAAAASGDFALAASFAAELRDHPSAYLPVRARRAASLSAARYHFRTGAADACEAAWTRAEQIAPDLFANHPGIHTRLERARALADLRDSPEPLEDLWNTDGVRDYHSCLLIASALATRYQGSEAPESDELAFSVLSEAWTAVVAREAQWRAEDPDGLDSLARHARIILHRATALAIHLEHWDEALDLAQIYRDRYDSEHDHRGAAWVMLALDGMNAGQE